MIIPDPNKQRLIIAREDCTSVELNFSKKTHSSRSLSRLSRFCQLFPPDLFCRISRHNLLLSCCRNLLINTYIFFIESFSEIFLKNYYSKIISRDKIERWNKPSWIHSPPSMEIGVIDVSPPLIWMFPRYHVIVAAGFADRTTHSKRRDSPTFTSIFFLFGWLLISTFCGGAVTERIKDIVSNDYI